MVKRFYFYFFSNSATAKCMVSNPKKGQIGIQVRKTFFDRKDPSNIVQEYCYEIAVWMFYLVFR